jgi:hypothetical protein
VYELNVNIRHVHFDASSTANLVACMTLGPLTRQALADIGIDEKRLNGITDGTYEWTIGRAPTHGISADEATAARIAEEAAIRKDFAITISRTEAAQRAEQPYDMSKRGRRVYEAAIPNAIGQRIAGIKRYEDALVTRGEAKSVMFAEGTPDDWGSVAVAPTWDALAFEFRQAADMLSKPSADRDSVPMLPLLTLCRHHLELALKSIIMAGDRLAGNAVNLPTRHPLIPLWQRALPLMRAAWKQGWVEDDAASAGKVIAEFDEIDPDSMATRYPVNKSNEAFVRPTQLLNFSPTAFMAAFSSAADFLSGANLWIEVGLRLKAEGIDS